MSHRIVQGLEGNAVAWDALVDQMELPSPFLRSWWLDAVAASLPAGVEAQIVLVLDGAELIGGLALQRTTVRGVEVLSLLGSGPLEPDHLDVVAAPDRRAEVGAALRSWMGRPGSRMFDLRGVAGGSTLVDVVPGWGEVTEQEVAPFVPLPASPEEYLAARGGRTRSTVKRTAKRLAAAGVEFREIDSADPVAVEGALETLAGLHDGRWGDASGFLAAWTPFSAAVRAGAAVGEVRFGELVDSSGTPIAIEVDFVIGGRTSFYQAGRLTDHDFRGSGSVLRYRIISAAIERGDHEFDLLRGGENYKAEWASTQRALLRIRRGVGPLGKALVGVARANVALQDRRERRAAAHTREDRPLEVVAGDGAAPTRRLAFYTDAAQIGGAETVATTLLKGLNPRFEVTVIGAHRDVVNHLVASRPGASAVITAPIDDRSDVAAMWGLRRLLGDLRPDIFHANLSEGSSCQYALLMALSVPNLRVVATENSPLGVHSELSRAIKRRSAPLFDAHIGVGREAARLVEADTGLRPGSVEVIPNAIAVIDHPPRTRTDSTVRVVAVSRFDPVKGLDVLIDAVGHLDRSSLPAFEVVIYGDGPERASLEAQIERLGVGDLVTLAGWIDDVRAALVECDLFVLPSRLEGLPMSLLEAMHASVAVIATDVGSVREVLDSDDVGIVVESGAAEPLAAAMAELIADPQRRASLARTGHEVALRRYSADSNIAAYEAVYDRVMAAPTKRGTAGRNLLQRFRRH
ncbi:MAG: GNAT family N-acetyltransferase [Actinobacteria bacterium]|nr:GNAT family N-acetyltransferase [Actinomycetota bacterium]